MIAVLVPVLGRAQQIEPLLASLSESTTTPYRVIFLCSPGDETVKACRKAKQKTIVVDWEPGKADYAKKLALGYQETDEPWLFQGATDLRFHHAWDTEALGSAKAHRRGVIGTNDLGNPLVIRGRHSTHSLISRAYLDHWGGTGDGSGTVFSEAYDHQWSDNEFIETATRRRQFFSCRSSVVEHLHPHWGKGEHDETYEKAFRATKEDMSLFVQRRRVSVRSKIR